MVALVAAAGLSALWIGPMPAALALAVVAALFFGDAWAVHGPPDVQRRLPEELARGRTAPFAVEVARRPAITVRVRQPQTADVRFTPAEGPDSLSGTVLASRRGRHEIAAPVTRSTGPLRLASWTHRHGPSDSVDVHADLLGARRLAAAVRSGTFRDPGLRRGELGLGTDFESVRDYTPDDDIRRMNWLASERTGRPMVNQYREDTERDLWCLIDTGRLLASPVGDRTRLDAALDAVAAVAAVADVVGDRVGAVVFDETVRQVVKPRRASAAGLVRLLDPLQPSVVDSDFESAFARVGATKRALVVVFTDLLDQAASAPLLDAVPVLVRRHAVVVAGTGDPDLLAMVTTDPSTARDLHSAVVAGDLLAERDEVALRLSAARAIVVDAPVDQLPVRCVAAYLRLKATARL